MWHPCRLILDVGFTPLCTQIARNTCSHRLLPILEFPLEMCRRNANSVNKEALPARKQTRSSSELVETTRMWVGCSSLMNGTTSSHCTSLGKTLQIQNKRPNSCSTTATLLMRSSPALVSPVAPLCSRASGVRHWLVRLPPPPPPPPGCLRVNVVSGVGGWWDEMVVVGCSISGTWLNEPLNEPPIVPLCCRYLACR